MRLAALARLMAVTAALMILFPAATLAFQTPPAAQLRGVLLNAEGLPASGFQLGLKSRAGDLYLAPPTGVDGSFAIEGLPAGPYQVVAFAPDGTEFPVVGGEIELAAGAVERLEIRLRATGHSPGRPPEAAPPETPRPGGGNWFSRLWNSGPGGKAGLIAIVVGGGYGIFELVDDDDDSNAASPTS